MEWISDPNAWVALLTLTVLEIVLGIDNIVFISILVGKLPHELQARARTIGLSLAMITRILLLLTISIIISLTNPLFSILELDISVRDLILLGGGLFLIVKATQEVHAEIAGEETDHATSPVKATFNAVVLQIVVIDAIFSIDSIITAVGMAEHVEIMIAAVVVAIGVMYVAAEPVANFIERNPTTKMLALNFLMVVGVALVADGFHFHIPRAYIYSAMAFAALTEVFNLMAVRRRRYKPQQLRRKDG